MVQFYTNQVERQKDKGELKGIDFDWSFYDNSICVFYLLENEVTEKCLRY